MPPRKKTVQVDDTGDEARVQTRSTNVNKHPGAEAQAVLRVSKPRRPPEVIQEEKDQKKAKKEAKAKEMLEEKVRLEALEQELEEYRAQQEVEIEKEGAMIPRHQSRSKPAPSKVKKASARPSDPPATVEGPNHAIQTPTTSVNNKGKKRDIVLANDGEETVVSAKKAKTSTPQIRYPAPAAPHPTQAITPKASSLNATGAMAMSDRGESQGRPTKKRSIQAADDNVDDDVPDATVATPVRSSKKVKTATGSKLNEPQFLHRTETIVQFDGERFSVKRPTKSLKTNLQPRPEIPAKIESRGTMQRQGEQNVTTDEDIAPYETPRVLKKTIKKTKGQPEIKEKNKDNTAQQDVTIALFQTPKVSKKTKKRVLPASETEGMISDAGEENKVKVKTTGQKKGKNKRNDTAQQSTVGTATGQASRSAPTSRAASVIQLAPSSRTTSLNNIKAVTKVTPQPEFKLKAKRSGKAKPKTADGFDSGSDIGLSDEDDSQERKVALRSPEKGAEARKSSKTRIKTTRKDTLVALPKEAELLFSTVVVPTFVGKYFADGNGWETPLLTYLPMLQEICDRVYGQEQRLKITEDTEAWKKATQTQLWDYRSRIKTKAMQVVEEDFIATHGEEALGDVEKRIAYGKSLCTKGDHKFTFGIINPNGKRKAQFENKLIVETLSVHFAFATAKKKLPNFQVGDPEVALALATSAVERALVLWRDDHLIYDRNILKHLRKTSAQDFSGSNYKSITLGWLERIREKRKKDNTFFVKVCKEAHNLYLATGKSKLSATGSGSADKHSDMEIEERIGVMSDSDDSDEGTNMSKGIVAMPDAVGGTGDGGNGNHDADDRGDDDSEGSDDDENDGDDGDGSDEDSEDSGDDEDRDDDEESDDADPEAQAEDPDDANSGLEEIYASDHGGEEDD